MVTALLELTLRFTAEVLAAELVTGVIAAELLCKLLASVLEKKKTKTKNTFRAGQPYRYILPFQNKETTALSAPRLWVTENINTSLSHSVNCGNIFEETYLYESCQLGLGRSYLKSLLPSTHLRGKFKKQDQ